MKKTVKIVGKSTYKVRKIIAPPEIVFADTKHKSRAKNKRQINREIKKQLENYP